jgi:hypothetical protein
VLRHLAGMLGMPEAPRSGVLLIVPSMGGVGGPPSTSATPFPDDTDCISKQ